MSNHRKVKKAPRARCFRETCTRRGKVKHECVVCGMVLRACNFHHEVCFEALKKHVITEHPAEYRAARDAQMHAQARTASAELALPNSVGPQRIEPAFVTPIVSVGKKP